MELPLKSTTPRDPPAAVAPFAFSVAEPAEDVSVKLTNPSPEMPSLPSAVIVALPAVLFWENPVFPPKPPAGDPPRFTIVAWPAVAPLEKKVAPPNAFTEVPPSLKIVAWPAVAVLLMNVVNPTLPAACRAA